MSICVNITSQEFKDFFKSYYPKETFDINNPLVTTLSAKIGVWREKTGNSGFPNVLELKEDSFRQNIETFFPTEKKVEYLPESLVVESVPEQYIGNESYFTDQAIKAFNAFFFHELFQDINSVTALFQEGNNRVYTDILEKTENKIREKYDILQKSIEVEKNTNVKKQLQEFEQNYNHLLRNLDKVIDLHQLELQKYNLEIIDNDFAKNNLEKDSTELWATESLKYSSKQKATSNTRLLIGTLKNKSEKNIFYTVNLVDFGKIFNLLANRLSNITNTTDLIKALKELNQIEPALDQLVNKLVNKQQTVNNKVEFVEKTVDDYTLGDVIRLLEFAQTFSKHYNRYEFAFVGEKGQFTLVDAVINTSQKRMLDEWSSNEVMIADSVSGYDSKQQNLFLEKDGAFLYNTSFFKNQIPSTLYKAAITQKNEIFSLTDLEKKEIAKRIGKKAQDLSDIEIKYHTYVKFLNMIGANIQTDQIATSDKFYNNIDFIIKTIRDGDTGLIYGRASNVKNALAPVIEHIMESTPDFVENQFLNFANETQYNVQLNSYLTLVEDKIRGATSLEQVFEQLPHLNNVFSKSSKTLQMIIDGKLDLTMSFFEGLKDETSQKAIQFSKLSHTDKIVFNINTALEGKHPFYRAGDNSQERIYPVEYYNKKLSANEIREMFVKDTIAAFENEILYFREIFNDAQKYNKALLDDAVQSSIFSDIIIAAKLETSFINAITTEQKLTLQEINQFEQALENEINQQIENLKDYILKKEIIYIEKTKTPSGEIQNRYISRGLSGSTTSDVSYFSEASLNSVLTKILANRTMWNLEQLKLFVGHPMYYGTADNFFKRMSAAVGTKKKSIADELTIPLLEKKFPRKNSKRIITENGIITKTAVFADLMVSSELPNLLKKYKAFKNFDFSAYEKMNEADAISYLSLDFYRDLRITNGDWTNADERLYHWVNKGDKKSVSFINFDNKVEVITEESQLVNANGERTVFNMLKPQYFGPLAEKGFIPAMYKTGAVPLLPNINAKEFPNVAKIQQIMKLKNIDVVTFESANKVGTKLNKDNKIQELFTLENTEQGTIGKIDFDTLQTDIVTQDTYLNYWGIQLDTGHEVKNNVIKGSQFMKLITSNLFNDGKPISPQAKRLHDKFQKIHEELIEIGVQELKEEFSLIEQDGTYNPESVQKIIDVLLKETSKRNANHNVLTSINLLKRYIDKGLGIDVLSNRDKIENVLMAIADSRVFSQKINGSGFIQMPSTLFEKNINGDGYRYTNKNLNYLSNNVVKLLPDGTLQVMLPYRFKDKIDIANIDENALKLVGFRIPTSGLNSIEKIQVVDFLPAEYGDTILLPSEIVAKAGSDFDIDKLQIFIPNVYREKNTLKAYQYLPNEKNTRQQLENGLIKTAWEILDLGSNLPQHLESIATTNIKKERNRIIEAREISEKKLSFTQMVFNMAAYNDITQRNITSKQLTGIAALHVTDHQNAIKNGYYVPESWGFEEGSYHIKEGGVSFGNAKTVKDENGNSIFISSNLNEGVNASVDGAKDPLFFDLNISLDNANVIFTLMRSGMTLKNIMTLINQPIIRDYVELNSLKKSLLNKGEQLFLTEDGVNNRLNSKYGINAFNGIVSFSEMETMLNEKEVLKSKEFKEKQKRILLEYKKVERTSDKLNNYIQSTRIDTEAGGKNSSEFDLRLFHANRVANNQSGIINANKIFEDGGFLKPYYDALKAIESLYTPYFFHKNDTQKYSDFMEIYNGLVEKYALNPYITLDTKVKILDTFKSDYISAHLMQAELTFADINYGKISDKLISLISGKNSVAKRGKKLKESGFKNPLLDNLYFVLGSESVIVQGQTIKPDHVKMYDQKLDALEANMMIQGFRELFQNPETKEFAADLAALTIAQSGLQNSPMTYTKLIPAEYYMEMIDSALSGDSTLGMDWYETSFYFSNYHIEELVPTVYNLKDVRKFPISKHYSYFKEYLKLDFNGRKAYRQTGKPYKNPKPVFYINLKHKDVPDSFKLRFSEKQNSEGVVKYHSPGYRDLAKNKMLSSYHTKTFFDSMDFSENKDVTDITQRLENAMNYENINFELNIDFDAMDAKINESLEKLNLDESTIEETIKCKTT